MEHARYKDLIALYAFGQYLDVGVVRVDRLVNLVVDGCRDQSFERVGIDDD